MKISFVRSLLAPALLVGSLSGCEGLISGGDEFQRDQYRAALNRWEDADLSSYSYTLELACACGTPTELRPVIITVENGVPVSRMYEGTPPTPAPAALFAPYDTVEELFALIDDTIDRESDLLNIVYHPTYGVPLLLQWDPDQADPDDHLVFEVSGFAPPTAP